MSHSRAAENPPGRQTTNRPTPLEALEPSSLGQSEPILCRHCGRTASNGISCEGYCVADSGY
jgi:hypothetical protein